MAFAGTGQAIGEQASSVCDGQVALRVRFLSHLSQDILLVDFSGAKNAATVRAVAAECQRIVATRPPGSVQTLVNVTGTWFDKESLQIASDLAAHNRAYVTHSAVIGVTGLLQVAFNAIVTLTKRNMKLFDTRDQALAWLTAEGGKSS